MMKSNMDKDPDSREFLNHERRLHMEEFLVLKILVSTPLKDLQGLSLSTHETLVPT